MSACAKEPNRQLSGLTFRRDNGGNQMKIARFSQDGHAPRLGAFKGEDRIVDLAASCAAYLADKGVVRAGEIAAALFPQSTRGFLEGGVRGRRRRSVWVRGTRA